MKVNIIKLNKIKNNILIIIIILIGVNRTTNIMIMIMPKIIKMIPIIVNSATNYEK